MLTVKITSMKTSAARRFLPKIRQNKGQAQPTHTGTPAQHFQPELPLLLEKQPQKTPQTFSLKPGWTEIIPVISWEGSLPAPGHPANTKLHFRQSFARHPLNKWSYVRVTGKINWIWISGSQSHDIILGPYRTQDFEGSSSIPDPSGRSGRDFQGLIPPGQKLMDRHSRQSQTTPAETFPK